MTSIQQTLFPDAAPAPWDIMSHCGKYRYLLAWPTGLDNSRIALGIFANPSTATRDRLDPTLTRWLNYCRDWGYGWSWTVNVRAWRETDPKMVPADPEAIGPENDLHIVQACLSAEIVVCGWGKVGGDRGLVVLDLIRRSGKVPHALKRNADGSPQHPLYLPRTAKPIGLEREKALDSSPPVP